VKEAGEVWGRGGMELRAVQRGIECGGIQVKEANSGRLNWG